MAQAANAAMQQQERGGVIVFIGSISALRPSPGTAAYGTAKAAVLNLTSSLAVEWAPKVRVVAVSPGLVRTEQSALHYGDEQGLANVAATIPAGRMAEPQDIANACLFVSSPPSFLHERQQLAAAAAVKRPPSWLRRTAPPPAPPLPRPIPRTERNKPWLNPNGCKKSVPWWARNTGVCTPGTRSTRQ